MDVSAMTSKGKQLVLKRRLGIPQITGHSLRITALHSSRCYLALSLLFLVAPWLAQMAGAGVITWEVDPTNSYIRLTIPDQTISVTGFGDVILLMRDATSATQWSDAGGRRAALGGQILTEYADGSAITFLSGLHNIYALEATSLRPNPDDWDDMTQSYTNTSVAPSALGARVRGTYSIFTFDAAFAAFRSVTLDIANASSDAIPISNGSFATNSTGCGIASALVDTDGLELPLELGQPIPDLLHEAMYPAVDTNICGGTITNLGVLNRKLTYTLDIPNLTFYMSRTTVTGSAAGLIIAYAVLPPTLLASKQGADLVLSWPTNAAGYSLQCTTNLTTPNWVPVSPSPVILDGENVVTNGVTQSAAFYRLYKP